MLWMASEGDDLIFRSEAPTWSWAAYHGRVEMWDLNYDVFDNSGWFPLMRGDYVATVNELVPAHTAIDSSSSSSGSREEK